MTLYTIQDKDTDKYLGKPRDDWKQSFVPADQAAKYFTAATAKSLCTRKKKQYPGLEVKVWHIKIGPVA